MTHCFIKSPKEFLWFSFAICIKSPSGLKIYRKQIFNVPSVAYNIMTLVSIIRFGHIDTNAVIWLDEHVLWPWCYARSRAFAYEVAILVFHINPCGSWTLFLCTQYTSFCSNKLHGYLQRMKTVMTIPPPPPPKPRPGIPTQLQAKFQMIVQYVWSSRNFALKQ